MSYSSLWVMDKDYNGCEVEQFSNSWLFSPMVWDVLSDKYIRGLIETPYGFKKSLMSDGSLWNPLNKKINNSNCMSDRICWELSMQQIFFTKDKEIIAKSIKDFIEINSKYDKSTEGVYPLQQEHIIERFKEIADEILKLDENKCPYFIFKNTSVDDNIESWFSKYDELQEEYVSSPLSSIKEYVTEFVLIENSMIKDFISNIDYFQIEKQ